YSFGSGVVSASVSVSVSVSVLEGSPLSDAFPEVVSVPDVSSPSLSSPQAANENVDKTKSAQSIRAINYLIFIFVELLVELIIMLLYRFRLIFIHY
ncbi:MAG TPA: hypothetical protein PLZ27_07050, partial [Bacillota bacterium]|nr:hypothetical protein [Bacillota bacterium]